MPHDELELELGELLRRHPRDVKLELLVERRVQRAAHGQRLRRVGRVEHPHRLEEGAGLDAGAVAAVDCRAVAHRRSPGARVADRTARRR